MLQQKKKKDLSKRKPTPYHTGRTIGEIEPAEFNLAPASPEAQPKHMHLPKPASIESPHILMLKK